MNFFGKIFYLALYQPLFNGLILIYNFLPGHDFGLAIILLTILIRIILYPLMAESTKSQKKLSDLQPKIEAARQKFKNNREKQAREIITLYQQEKINPFGGLLPILIQLPILFALYQVFSKGLQAEEMVNLYSFVSRPSIINSTLLGLINLSSPNVILAVLAGFIQFFQSKMTTPTAPIRKQKDTISQFSNIFQKQMLFLLPLLTLLFLLRLPAAFSLYWITTSLFSIFQQYLIFKESHA